MNLILYCGFSGTPILLIIFILLCGHSGVVFGQISCYVCVWMYGGPLSASIDLPSTAHVSDICRPHNFNADIVHKDTCHLGCITTILYEFDPALHPSAITSTSTTTTTSKPMLQESRKRRNGTDKPTQPTFFYRGCSKNSLPGSAPGCHEGVTSEGFFQRQCLCTTNLCNGESSAESLFKEEKAMDFLIKLAPLILLMGSLC